MENQTPQPEPDKVQELKDKMNKITGAKKGCGCGGKQPEPQPAPDLNSSPPAL